jgi:cyclopropane-fatty-acyl-phospholipid synthase
MAPTAPTAPTARFGSNVSADVPEAVAHPLIAPMPRLVPSVLRAVRRLALAYLRAGWSGGRLDVIVPSGERVRIGEPGPAEACVRVHDDRAFLRLLVRGEMGGGEAFVAGEWSSDDLVGAIRLVLRATDACSVDSPLARLAQLPSLVRHRRAANTLLGSQRNIHAHYDLGNAFYRLFLDDETVSCACVLLAPSEALAHPPHEMSARPGAPDPTIALADAQRAKLERICALLALSSRDHLLEIGCGWGGLAIHAARTRGCRVTAITVSRQQYELASARVAAAGLGERVDIQYRDYRELDGSYDKIASIEMLEAVGYEYLPSYFAVCARLLAPGGRFALQSITMPAHRFDAYRRRVDWMQTYIFPGSLIPSLGAIAAAARPAGFDIARSDDIGPSYALTLARWRERFVAALPAVTALGFDEPFVRTWLLYLAFSEAAFAERTLGDHQLLLTLGG